MLPLLAAATAGILFLRHTRRKPKARRPVRRRRVKRNPVQQHKRLVTGEKVTYVYDGDTALGWYRRDKGGFCEVFGPKNENLGVTASVKRAREIIRAHKTNPEGIIYEKGEFHVLRAPAGRKGYEIFKHEGTHAVKVSTVGFDGEKGIAWAIKEIDRRLALKKNPVSPELSRIVEHTLKLAKRGRWKAAWQHAGDAMRLIIRDPKLAEYRSEIIELRNALAARKLGPRWTSNPRKRHKSRRR